jgi:hypothetical protein
LWYNGERPHWGLHLKSPVQFLMEQKPEECKMWWPNTLPCLTGTNLLFFCWPNLAYL